MPFDDESSPIDLENIDYDDVLHLYRGSRRAEANLKEKSNECDSLRGKCEQLQEAHSKFRSQIQALESVKELTVNLQSQLNICQQDNNYLKKQNKQLLEAQISSEKKVQDILTHDNERNKLLRELRGEASMLRDRYEEIAQSHKDLELMLTKESEARILAESQIVRNDDIVDILRIENKSFRSKSDNMLIRMNQCNQELSHASEQISKLSHELSIANENKNNL